MGAGHRVATTTADDEWESPAWWEGDGGTDDEGGGDEGGEVGGEGGGAWGAEEVVEAGGGLCGRPVRNEPLLAMLGASRGLRAGGEVDGSGGAAVCEAGETGGGADAEGEVACAGRGPAAGCGSGGLRRACDRRVGWGGVSQWGEREAARRRGRWMWDATGWDCATRAGRRQGRAVAMGRVVRSSRAVVMGEAGSGGGTRLSRRGRCVWLGWAMLWGPLLERVVSSQHDPSR